MLIIQFHMTKGRVHNDELVLHMVDLCLFVVLFGFLFFFAGVVGRKLIKMTDSA